jgi:hypothetical protein
MGSRAQPVYRDFADAGSIGQRSLACDLSFVSDDSTPPHTLVARQVERLKNPNFAAVWWDVFDRLRRDEVVAHRARVMWHVHSALEAAALKLDQNWIDAIGRFFDQVNQVMFQHQTLDWLAEAQFKLHIYGVGWESHPKLARFARGEIEGDSMRLAIHRASRINLSSSVYGALTTRVSEGIGAGGFFLLRFTPADLIERFFPPIRDFCAQHGIETNAQLAEQSTPAIRGLLDFAGRTIGVHPLHGWPDFVGELNRAADAGYTRSAAAVWPEYPAVAFGSKDELLGLVERYLYDVPLRQRVADDMRRELRRRFEHVTVNRRIATPTEVAA